MKRKLTDNLNRIKDNIAQACARAKRDPGEVKIIAVTKYVEIDTIRCLLELGLADLGESYVQNLTQRQAMIAEFLHRQKQLPQTAPADHLAEPRWHMIGHLQRNKVKPILPFVHMIHSVDSLRLAEEINTTAARLGLQNNVQVFLQVKTSQEKEKFGLAVGAVIPLVEQVASLPNLHIVGLMTMAPETDNRQIQSFCFERCREIFEEIRSEKIAGPYFQQLSMGMSQDYVVAVEHGATCVRIGSALFQ